jgi:hypothetical protein
MIVNEVLQSIHKDPEHIWRKYEKLQLISVTHFHNKSQTFFLSTAAILALLCESGLMILGNTDSLFLYCNLRTILPQGNQGSVRKM